MNKSIRLAVPTLWLLLAILSTGFAQSDKKTKTGDTPLKPVLLVIDVQNAYLAMMSDDDKKLGMDFVNKSIELFRKENKPIIRIYHTDLKLGPPPGTKAFEYPASVAVNESDPKIIKNYSSAFTKTKLDALLKEKGCNCLFLCGLSAVGCVLATYYGAMDRGYEVFMVSEGLISHNAKYTDVIRDICNTVHFDKMKSTIEKKK